MGKLKSGEIKPNTLVLSLLVLLGVTFIAWKVTTQAAHDRTDIQFQYEADKAASQIEARFKNYQLILQQAAVTAELLGENLTRETWKHYISDLDIRRSMPGTQGIGYTVYIPAEDLAAHEAAIRAEGFPDYSVHPAGDRELYSAIIYLEPFDWRNQRAFGYDMYSEPVRKGAMDQARKENRVTISGRVTLVQETDSGVQQGFLMYAPVFEQEDFEGNRMNGDRRVVGNAYAVIRANDMVHGVIGDDHWEYSLIIHDQADAWDNGTPIAGNIYHSKNQKKPSQGHSPEFTTERIVDVGGRKWHIMLASTPEYEVRISSNTPWLVAGSGAIISFLIVGLISSLYGQSKRIELRAADITAELQETTDRLKIAQRATSFGVWEINLNDYSVIWDDLMFDLYAVDKKAFDPTYEAWKKLVLKEDLAEAEAALKAAISQDTSFSYVYRIGTHQNPKHLKVQAAILRDENSLPQRMIGISLDVTEEIRARAQEQLAARVFEFAQEGILITDQDAKIIDVNDTFLKITGFSREDVLGQNPSLLQSGVHEKDFYQRIWQEIAKAGYWSGEICNRKKSGEVYHELLHISVIKDDQGNVQNYIGIFSDITSLKNHERDLQEMATHDALTGLPNRLHLQARIAELTEEEKHSDRKIAFLYLDLDRFKSINDHHGHEAGDRYLREISRRLKIFVQQPHTVARIGGDEFVVIWLYWNDKDLKATISKLLQRISTPFCDNKIIEPLTLSASIGVSLYPDDGEDPDTLLRQADQAMYQAKQRGRGRVVYFDTRSDQAVEHRMQLFSEIDDGLASGQFELFYQPKVEINSGQPIGFEALIRWHHPTRGMLYPGEFMAETESFDIAISIGQWVIRMALGQIRALQEMKIDASISVNIAAIHLGNEAFVDELDELYMEFGSQILSKLQIEVLESYPLQDLPQAIEVMNHCVNYGVSFAIDDFGTGYSSLTYMKKLPADTLKIDQSFIRDMDTSDDDMTVVKSIIQIASIFHRTIIAEGVETETQAKMLESMGCQYAQGYYYAKPMPAKEAIEWWRKSIGDQQKRT